MRFFFLVTLFVISFHSNEADEMNIQCGFVTHDVGYGTKRGCTVKSFTLSSPDDREITSVNGDDGKTYDDVLWIYSGQTFNFIPNNFKNVFPNVEFINIYNGKIATLTKSDMSSLGPQLRIFSFYGNNIEVLEEGLFDENPNLEKIYLDRNLIRFVASEVFDKLPKLTRLHFQNNPCNLGYANDRAAVLTLIKQIELKCQDHEAYEKFRNLFTTSTTTTTEKVKTENELRIEELTAEVAELKQQQLEKDTQYQAELQKLNEERKDEKKKQLEEENEGLKKKLSAVKPCDELHEVRDSLMRELKELKIDLDKTNKKIDTTKDMIKATDAKLDSTLVKPMNSLHTKMDSIDLKLDVSDGKCVSMVSTCNSIEHKLNALKCIRMP